MMSTSEDPAAPTSISTGSGPCVIGRLEEALEVAYLAGAPDDRALEIDLSKCNYIDAPCLLYLLSLLRRRRTEGTQTTLKLPIKKAVRDFLRRWRFPQAYHDTVGLPFRTALTAANIAEYWGENFRTGEPPRYSGAEYAIDGKLEQLLPSSFFEIYTFLGRQVGSPGNLATRASSKWQASHVVRVLEKHLGEHGRRVGSHVVHEAMMNCFRHPQARVVQTTSQVVNDKQLVFAFWDDGESIVDTLRHALRDDGVIRVASVDPALIQEHLVSIQSRANESSVEHEWTTCRVPDHECEDEELLFASICPGITRNAKNPEFASPGPLPGMGLFVLTETVITLLGGSVAFRTKDLFMNLKRGEDPSTFRAKILRHRDTTPVFSGNMITARIPIRSQ